MQPTAIESGAKAIVCLGEAKGLGRAFPLILLDAQMPEMDGFALAECIKRNPDWRAATVMMLSSAGLRGDAMRCRELGIAAYLTKPVRPVGTDGRDFDSAWEREHEGNDFGGADHTPLVTRAPEAISFWQLFLVEDNPVNQLVALRLLEKERTQLSPVAANGRKALEALDKGSLRNCVNGHSDAGNGWLGGHPNHPGEGESQRGGHIPIVAVTAHAMKGDEERCLAAGMDYYLTKPIRTPELLATLQQIENCKPASNANAAPPAKTPPGHAIDLMAALERLDGDRALFDELVQVFAENCPKNIEAMRRAIVLGDAKGLEHYAHTLKGSSATVWAPLRFLQAAGEIERMAISNGVEKHQRSIRKSFSGETERLFGELEAPCATGERLSTASFLGLAQSATESSNSARRERS